MFQMMKKNNTFLYVCYNAVKHEYPCLYVYATLRVYAGKWWAFVYILPSPKETYFCEDSYREHSCKPNCFSSKLSNSM